MIVTLSDGKRINYRKNLDDTAFHTLVACTNAKLRKSVQTLIVSCGDADTNFTMVFTDENGDDYPIYNAMTIEATNTLVQVLEMQLDPGQSLRVKASAANKITVIAIALDAISVQDNPQGNNAVWANGQPGRPIA